MTRMLGLGGKDADAIYHHLLRQRIFLFRIDDLHFVIARLLVDAHRIACHHASGTSPHHRGMVSAHANKNAARISIEMFPFDNHGTASVVRPFGRWLMGHLGKDGFRSAGPGRDFHLVATVLTGVGHDVGKSRTSQPLFPSFR